MANYKASSTIIRNISGLQGRFTILQSGNPFSIIEIDAAGFDGSNFWVINTKGFLWEGFSKLAAAMEFAADPANREEALAA